MKLSAIQQTSIDPIINKINESITVRLKQAIDDYVREEIDKRSPFDAEDKKAALVGLIYNKLAIVVSISNKSIYDYLKGKVPTDSEKILEGFVSSIGFEQMFTMNTVYFKANGEFREFIETASINASGEISRIIYEFVGNSFVEFPQIKVAFPIFDAIKKRYAITAFSTPQVKRTDERGYKVFLYGYLKADMPCCPSYQIDMIYSKSNNTLTPVTAISIDRAYQNITMTLSLNDYQRIDKQMLINAD
jgi:hypothetical protein